MPRPNTDGQDTQPNNVHPFFTLPPELHTSIASHLGYKSACSFVSCNKYFHSLLEGPILCRLSRESQAKPEVLEYSASFSRVLEPFLEYNPGLADRDSLCYCDRITFMSPLSRALDVQRKLGRSASHKRLLRTTDRKTALSTVFILEGYQGPDSETPMQKAIDISLDTCMLFLQYGGSKALVETSCASRLLSKAIKKGRIDIIKKLFYDGVVTVSTMSLTWGFTPFQQAVSEHKFGIAEYFLERGSTVDEHGELGKSALVRAMGQKKPLRKVEFLLRFGPDLTLAKSMRKRSTMNSQLKKDYKVARLLRYAVVRQRKQK